ncbi:acetate--CoA ligase family protein [Noviherbaspirillum sedimenti]|uniref:CoA-binding protein n=1 Tax=Noviherbaspirillum sedimenti TaxID=2320865 RepID=A0A3A3GEJ8_9BURK|nr:acetate--CoA ligase family protein [Noviherbaspirillum sedimenti]RJG00666.1 CoA-binding protein [Noviherbaspirillum sedimenti]
MTVSCPLSRLFNPRSVVIIGASDNNPWSGMVIRTLKSVGFSGKVHLVNKRGAEVMGQATFTSCRNIGEPVDAAFLAVPAAALEDALEDMADAGIMHGVVVSSGFAETGPAGAAEQKRIFDRAAARGLKLLGPNSLGSISLTDSCALSAMSLDLPILPNGKVALISQSGATAGLLTKQAYRQNIALSHVVAMGNEACIDLTEVLEYMIEQPEVRAVAIFAESIRRPESFLAAAQRALALKKAIIILKVGTSELTAEVAQAHTGALVGDDRVFNAVCRQYGLVRVYSLEQLLITASVIAHVGPLEQKGFAVASISGGACEIMADAGSSAGIRFTRFAPRTMERLKDVVADFGAAHNPLDVTGAALVKPEILENVLTALAADPDVGLLACTFDMASTPAQTNSFTLTMLDRSLAGLATAKCPTLLIEQTMKDTTEYARELLKKHAVPILVPGMDAAMKAIGSAYQWSDRMRTARTGTSTTVKPIAGINRPRSERETLEYLQSHGVPVIPARVVRSREEAASAAQEMNGVVVLKILSPDIAHKTEVGGVMLNVDGGAAAADGYDTIMRNVGGAAPHARIDGIIVSPMRSQGTELFIGIVRDPSFGLAIAVGLGGIWIEALDDTALRLLPVTPDEVLEMFGELKAQRLLTGYRGAPPVDLAALSVVVAAVGRAAIALGPELASLEINPLSINADKIEALDALATWSASEPTSQA